MDHPLVALLVAVGFASAVSFGVEVVYAFKVRRKTRP